MEQNKEIVVTVKRLNKSFIVNDVETGAVLVLSEQKIPDWMLRKAVKFNVYLKKGFYKDGRPFWRQVSTEDYNKAKELGIDVPTKRSNRKKDVFQTNKIAEV